MSTGKLKREETIPPVQEPPLPEPLDLPQKPEQKNIFISSRRLKSLQTETLGSLMGRTIIFGLKVKDKTLIQNNLRDLLRFWFRFRFWWDQLWFHCHFHLRFWGKSGEKIKIQFMTSGGSKFLSLGSRSESRHRPKQTKKNTVYQQAKSKTKHHLVSSRSAACTDGRLVLPPHGEQMWMHGHQKANRQICF